MSNKRLKITPQGWLVLAAIGILIIALVIILIVFLPPKCSKEGGAATDPVAEGTPAPDPNATADATVEPTAMPTLAPTAEPVIEPLAKKVFTEPDENMIAYQVAATTNKNGVTLRSGPGKDFASINTETIVLGSALTVYQDFGQWVFCKVDAMGIIGYMHRQFIAPATGATLYMPTTDQPADTFIGTINANVLTLRSDASTSSSMVNEYYLSQVVYIHYISGEFYYVTCAGSGETGYMKSSYITTSDVIPTQP